MEKDSGYAWFVLICAFLSNGIMCAILLSPTLFLVNFTEAFNLSTQQAAWFCSINCFFQSLSMIVSGLLIDRLGCRTVGFSAAVLEAACLCAASQIENIYAFLFVYSFLAGSLLSGTALASIVVINIYFDKRRAFANALTLAGNSVGGIVLMPVIGFCIDYYGWRGAMMLLGGLSLNMCVFIMAYFPFKDTGDRNINHNKSKVIDQKQPKSLWNIIKDPMWITMAVSHCMFQFGADFMFRVSVPRAELDLHFYKVKAASVVSALSIGGLIMRVVSSVVSNLRCTNVIVMYTVGILLGGLIVLGSVFFTQYYLVSMAAAAYGLTYGMVHSVLTTILVLLLGVSNIARAQGLVNTCASVVFLVCNPFAGWMYDMFGTFRDAYIISGIVQYIGGLVSVIVLVRNTCMRRKCRKDMESNEKIHTVETTPIINRDEKVQSYDACLETKSIKYSSNT